ncbi:MAG: hypothetical protein IPJ77_14145 [Planctomycetes bacterium]|nr:hypothetical protein [Planctomycetota bacterium]
MLPRRLLLLAVLSIATFTPLARAGDRLDLAGDVTFAVSALEKECGALLASKKIDWKKATAPILADAKKLKEPAELAQLLVRLLARLEDGHSELRPLPAAKDVKVDWPDKSGGPGMFVCRSGKKLYVKSAWATAAEVGLEPGMELLTIDGLAAEKWMEKRVADLRDVVSFSTDQQASYYACHWGLADAIGTRLEIEVKTIGGEKKKRTVTFAKRNQVPNGPAFPPETLDRTDDLAFGRTQAGYGYIHLRRMKESVVEQLDEALAKVGEVPGLVLDFRANGGGGFDHEAFIGRFVPAGKTIEFAVKHASAGPRPYGGPIVVIVDGGVRSAGETAADLFKEDGRGYVIGESATAGMSSSKTTIELPSKLFALYVSTRSNHGRANGGKGLEGIGLIPHELVEYAPKDLAAKRDTMILRAEALFAKFPQDKVPYDPAKFGWTAPAGK